MKTLFILLILVSCQVPSDPVLLCKEVKVIKDCNPYSKRCEVEFTDKTTGYAQSPTIDQMCLVQDTALSKYSMDIYYSSSEVQEYYKNLVKERDELRIKQSNMYIHAYH